MLTSVRARAVAAVARCGCPGRADQRQCRGAAAPARLHDDDAAQRAATSCFSKITRRRSCTSRSGITSARRTRSPGRTGFAHLFEHMMFKGSKNVEPEGHPSYISSVGGQSNAYTNEDATVFWETVPAQYLPLILWLEADRMASLRIDEKAFKTEREVVKEERRMRIENQPYGRLQEIIDDQAFTVHPYKHPDDRQHEGSRRRVDRRRARVLPAPTTCPTTRPPCWSATSTRRRRSALVTQYLGRVPKSDTAGAARHSEGAAADEGKAGHADRRRGRCRRSSSRTTSPSTAIRTRIRCTSPRRSCPTARARGSIARWSTRSGIALAAFGGGNIIEDPNLFFAVAIVQPGHTTEEAINALIAELDRLRERAGHRRRAAAGEEPVRARLHPRPRVEPEQGGAARARGRDSQRHQDRRRRVRHLPEHHRGRRAARRAAPTSRRRTGSC